MLPFATETITIYNKYEGINELNKPFTQYVRTVLAGCTWGRSNSVMTVGTVTVGSDDFRVQIPASTDYKPSQEWSTFTLEDARQSFTVSVGDFVVLGDVDDELPVNTSTSSLQTKYKNRCFTARLALDFASAGQPLPHYVLQGK